jgi:hypothetical protein
MKTRLKKSNELGGEPLEVLDATKAFGVIFVGLKDLKHIDSLAYKKSGYLYVYLKKGVSFSEKISGGITDEIKEVFTSTLRLSFEDVKLKENRDGELKFNVLNEQGVKRSFNRLYKKFKSEK